jgi:hypothetical protein
MFPLSLNNYIEIVAFLTSVIFWFKLKKTGLRWFMPYLLFVVVVELTGRYYSRELHKSNAWLYNVSIPLEYLFYTYLFFVHYYNRKFKKIATGFFLIFPLFTGINFLFIQQTVRFNTNFLKVGSFFMIIFCCLYFIDLLRIEKIVNPLKLPMFWISSGLLLFNAGEFVYNTFFELFFKNWDNGLKLFREINNNLIYILYCCIIIGIISLLWNQEE